ncbi:hypothetical protein VNO77_02427 [Canavalia gladiata]|uniref:Uncharacterized protein n=1 Tax=Canavalia gladiata TaxID=3824 RepID=A0AAN9MT91_CANGL
MLFVDGSPCNLGIMFWGATNIYPYTLRKLHPGTCFPIVQEAYTTTWKPDQTALLHLWWCHAWGRPFWDAKHTTYFKVRSFKCTRSDAYERASACSHFRYIPSCHAKAHSHFVSTFYMGPSLTSTPHMHGLGPFFGQSWTRMRSQGSDQEQMKNERRNPKLFQESTKRARESSKTLSLLPSKSKTAPCFFA